METPRGTQVSVLLGFDHGIRPGAEVCLLAYYWRNRLGDPYLYVLDEYTSPGRTTEDQDALAIQRMIESHGLSLYSIDLARGDVNAAGKSAARFSVNQTFDRAFRALAGSQPFVGRFTRRATQYTPPRFEASQPDWKGFCVEPGQP